MMHGVDGRNTTHNWTKDQSIKVTTQTVYQSLLAND